MFEHKSDVRSALKSLVGDDDGVSIHIGDWEPWGTRPPMSLVSARYRTGTAIGTVGVIGPARIQYPRLAALVKYAAAVTSHYFASC